MKAILYKPFTEQDLVESGWVKGWFYPAGSSKEFGYEYFYEKNNKTIRVNEKTLSVLTYDGKPAVALRDLEEINKYAE